MIKLLLHCIFIGFAVAMPVGPIGITCMEHGFRGGFRSGLAAGLGAALADALFGILGASGVGVLFTQVKEIPAFRIIGALIILVIGLKTLLTPIANNCSSEIKSSRFKAFATTFGLTVSNPMTILCFSGVIASMGLPTDPSHIGILNLTGVGVGIFVGSSLWWLLLATLAGIVKTRIDSKFLLWVSNIAGALLIMFGTLMLWEGVYHLIF